MASLKVGSTLRSVTDATTVIVIAASGEDLDLTCGGAPMASGTDDVSTVPADPDHESGTLLGKRYEDALSTIELLCTKGGTSSLALGGVPLVLKSAKPLPASD